MGFTRRGRRGPRGPNLGSPGIVGKRFQHPAAGARKSPQFPARFQGPDSRRSGPPFSAINRLIRVRARRAGLRRNAGRFQEMPTSVHYSANCLPKPGERVALLRGSRDRLSAGRKTGGLVRNRDAVAFRVCPINRTPYWARAEYQRFTRVCLRAPPSERPPQNANIGNLAGPGGPQEIACSPIRRTG